MHYTVPSTGEVVKVYLFVATLPFSQYSYVEATKDAWLMYEMSDQDKQFISELMEIRHDTCSTIFCSQYPTEEWYDKLHKSTLTESLLDRIVHNRIDIDMGTDNFRIK